jgi:hypothetical protein
MRAGLRWPAIDLSAGKKEGRARRRSRAERIERGPLQAAVHTWFWRIPTYKRFLLQGQAKSFAQNGAEAGVAASSRAKHEVGQSFGRRNCHLT